MTEIMNPAKGMDAEVCTEISCAVCMDACTTDRICEFCPDSHLEVLCGTCTGEYITQKISDSFLGSCPQILCPLKHGAKQQRILRFGLWSKSKYIAPAQVEKYTSLAKNLLAFLCSGCHRLKSLSVTAAGVSSISQMSARSTLQNAMRVSPEKYTAFDEALQCYTNGISTADDFYTTLCACLPVMATGADKEIWELFKNVLVLIDDPERQSNLHLRHLRVRPRIWTPCCSKEHCYKCQTKDFHEGKTCAENSKSQDGSVVQCPSCEIAISKGDGCNSVTCVCGKQFSWSDEKINQERSNRFSAAYSSTTAHACMEVLLQNQSPTANEGVRDAIAWQARHRIEVNQELIHWWLTKHGLASTQACCLMEGTSASIAEKQASQLWTSTHISEYKRSRVSNRCARHVLFPTLYPNPHARGSAAVQLLGDKDPTASSRTTLTQENSKMIESARLWADAHPTSFKNARQARALNQRTQFLYLYGNKRLMDFEPNLQPMGAVASAAGASRPASTRGAAMGTQTVHKILNREHTAMLHSLKQYLVQLYSPKTTKESSSLSTNVRTGFVEGAYVSVVARSSLAGCEAVGIITRIRPDGLVNIHYLNGDIERNLSQEVLELLPDPPIPELSLPRRQHSSPPRRRFHSPPRRLYLRDEEDMDMDAARHAYYHRSINDFFDTGDDDRDPHELLRRSIDDYDGSDDDSERSSGSSGSSGPFSKGIQVMLAPGYEAYSDARAGPLRPGDIGIITQVSPTRVRASFSGNDWWYDLAALLPIDGPVRDSAAQAEEEVALEEAVRVTEAERMRIAEKAQQWIDQHGSAELAHNAFMESVAVIEHSVGVPLHHSLLACQHQQQEKGSSCTSRLTWNQIECAISWKHKFGQEIFHQQRVEMDFSLAVAFECENEGNASFVAAAALAHENRGSTAEEVRRAAKAYMRSFPEEMNRWYDYNATLSEPMFGLCRSACRCLPRHRSDSHCATVTAAERRR